jgi:hypothetical protein
MSAKAGSGAGMTIVVVGFGRHMYIINHAKATSLTQK